MTVLAIETSCDDTCAAVMSGDGALLSNVISSQGVHDRYGGVVPEIASRHHLDAIGAVVDDALARAGVALGDVQRVAVTQGPGLIGALLVGLSYAKGVGAVLGVPLVAVDHLQGHVAASFVGEQAVEPPFLCLVASGGHTFLASVSEFHGYEVVGRTLDDAAGEAIDKGARLLGLPFPGGPALEALATEGDASAFAFPVPRTRPPARRPGRARSYDTGLDFSFAGLKTALLYRVRELGEEGTRERTADLAASYQAAIVESLTLRVQAALERTGHSRLAIGGGVAANGPLRERLAGLGVPVSIPPRELCTDNAAMIASASRWAPAVEFPGYLSLDAYPTGGRRAQ